MRAKVLYARPEILLWPIEEGRTHTCLAGLPRDYTIERVTYNEHYPGGRLEYLISSPEWDDIPDGTTPPELIAVMKDVTYG